MNRNELIQIQHDFISTFQTLTRKDKLEFLNFNRYHHKRPIQDVISIFVQYPDARYLGSFDFWKDYSTESSVQFGQKVAVRLYDKQGRLSEQLFDIAQTTLHTVPDIRDTVLSDRLLTNSLAELTDNDYFIGEEHYGQYFESISDYIEQYIQEHVPAQALESYSPKQQQLALTLAKYNICEEFGAFLEDSERYEAFLDKISTSIDEMDSEDNLLRTFALGNNYSKELSTQVYSLYEEVEKRTENLIKEQATLNEKIASLDSDLSFEKPDVFDIQNENSNTKVEENVTEEVQENQQHSTDLQDNALASDQAFLEAVIEHFELSDKFIIQQDETSTALVKENPWGTEVLLSMDGELEVSAAAWGLTDDRDFDKHVKQYYFDYYNQEFQYKVGDFLFLEGQYMASGYDEDIIKITSLPEDSAQPMLTERAARRIVDGYEPTDYNYYPQIKLYRYQTAKARLASDEEIEIFNATKDKATTKQVDLFDTEKEVSEASTETIDLDVLSPEEIEQAREKEIKEDLLRGSGIQEGKFRIYYFLKNNSSKKDRISFLKDEYGVGGHSPLGESKYTQMHDAKGLHFYSSDDEVLLPWQNVAERLDLLIASNEYFTDKELEKFQAWKAEKESSIKANSIDFRYLSNVELEDVRKLQMQVSHP